MFSDSSSTSSSVVEAPEFILIPSVDSSSDSHSEEKRARHLRSNISEGAPEDMFQGYRGQLKLSVYVNGGLLTVHIICGRNFGSVKRTPCNAYVKVALTPDDSKKTRCKTEVVRGSSSPTFDEKFSFEMIREDIFKRVFISVWNRDNVHGECEFLGCMSFSVRSILERKKRIHGWYYLLIGDVGRQRHLRVQDCHGVRREDTHLQAFSVPIWRGPGGGFGFSISGSGMVQVCRVNPFALSLGLRLNDIVLRIDGQNVIGLSTDAVAKIIRNIPNYAVLEVQRPEMIKPKLPNSSPGRVGQRSGLSLARRRPQGIQCGRSSATTMKTNYGWLDGLSDGPEFTGSSCGSSRIALDTPMQVDATPLEAVAESKSHQGLEMVDDGKILESENIADGGNMDDDEEEEEEDCNDYMDNFKDNVSCSGNGVVNSSQEQNQPQKLSAGDEANQSLVGAGGHLPRRNSLKFLNLDKFTPDFYSLRRSVSKTEANAAEKINVPRNCATRNGALSSTTDLAFNDLTNSEAVTSPIKAPGLLRSSSFRCMILPKLSKLKGVFRHKN